MNSEKNFIKTMIENGYEKMTEHSDDKSIVYGLNYIRLEELGVGRIDKMSFYNIESGSFLISDREKIDYKTIIDKIKTNCVYYDILDYNGTDFLSYSCSQSKYSGKIGYTVMEGMGTIVHFPKPTEE